MVKKSLQKFAKDESGAVTIEWIILSASVFVGVCLACAPLVSELPRGAAGIAYVLTVGEMPVEEASGGPAMPQAMN